MSPARALRVRTWRVGATAALTVVASGLITVGTTSAASADEFCDQATVSTFATGSVSTPPLCVNTSEPYSCSFPSTGLGTLFEVDATLCVID
jgi:hypothetical protein